MFPSHDPGGTTVTADQGVGGLFDALNAVDVPPPPPVDLPDLIAEDGARIPSDEEKMMIMAMKGALLRGETPGEFSHENNPIDIMQDGAKIGEMTGGEGIISPEDMGKMEQLAGKGNTPLHKFVRSWFKKINKQNS